MNNESIPSPTVSRRKVLIGGASMAAAASLTGSVAAINEQGDEQGESSTAPQREQGGGSTCRP